jgi:hypothetical protein
MKPNRQIPLLLFACLLLSGCAHKLQYRSNTADVNESTAPYGAKAMNDFNKRYTNSPVANATEAPPYAVDKTLDVVGPVVATTVFVPVELVKPTVRDIPPITINKTTDMVHDGVVAVAKTTEEIVTPTGKAVVRSTEKLGNLFIATPYKRVDNGVRSIFEMLDQR